MRATLRALTRRRVDVHTVAAADAPPHRVWLSGVAHTARLMMAWPSRVRIVIEGVERLRQGPCLIAMNHTHRYDFLPLRVGLLDHDIHAVTWIKARTYQHPVVAHVLRLTGNVPILSKGYLILRDAFEVWGALPDPDTYRLLRDHVDAPRLALPDTPAMDALTRRPRTLLGQPFDPARSAWAETIRARYHRAMTLALRASASALDRGAHVHIYPQGSVAAQLSRGRAGIIQAALALDRPIVPVVCVGCREVFTGRGLRHRGGQLTLRVGAPWRPPPVPAFAALRPFHPDDERRLARPLQDAADALIRQLAALLPASERGDICTANSETQGAARLI